jgi:hypothetical protein
MSRLNSRVYRQRLRGSDLKCRPWTYYWTKWITAKTIRAQRVAKLSVNLPDGKFLHLGVLPA